jgi:cellulose synthase (UDP-forming)
MFIPVDTLFETAGPGLALGCLAVAAVPFLKREHTPTRVVVLGITIALMLNYMAWRCLYTLPPMGFTVDFAVGVFFLTAEMLAMIGGVTSLLSLTRIRNRSPEADAHMGWYEAEGKTAPLVDVFICTYNEEQAILERTIGGALNMDYPNFRVWVLDDGRRDWLKDLAQELGCLYLTRPDNAHAKAGNINHALNHVAHLDVVPDFISILDADFVPMPNFLSRGMSLHYKDDVGVVQTPQHFINPDPIQINLAATRVWPDEQRFFFDIILPSRDAWGAAFCCGTSSIIRFKPLVEMGGFPTDSVTEDYLVTLRLKERGFRTVYLNEPLTLGLAPEGLKEYIVQRSRWCLGFMQIVRGPSGPFSRQRRISLLDRMFLIDNFLNWFAAHGYRLLGILVPITYLLFDVIAVDVDVSQFVTVFLPFFLWQSVTMSWLTSGRVIPIFSDVAQLLSAPSLMRACYQGLFKPKGQKFKVTAKGGDRSKRFVEWPMLRTFLILLVLTLAGIVWSFILAEPDHANAAILALFWSWYNIVLLTIACYVCIEQPRQRKAERFDTNELAVIAKGGALSTFRLFDISLNGAGFSGTSPGKAGDRVAVRIAGTKNLTGRLMRVRENSFAVEFDDTPAQRIMLIHHIYSGRYTRVVNEIKIPRVLRAVGARLFG